VNQILGGATGAIIIGGMEQVRPEVADLPERVLILRQFTVLPPPPGKRSPDPADSDDNAPISLNFVPNFIKVKHPVIQMKPGERQLWRLVNSTSIYFLTLQLQFSGVPQKMELVAIDGIPLAKTNKTDTIVIPPAGRAEFIVQGPPSPDIPAQFLSLGFDTGPAGDFNPPWLLAEVMVSNDAPPAPNRLPAFTKKMEVTRFANLAAQKPSQKRKLYFSESTDPSSPLPEFFITVDGQTPRLFNPDIPPAIVTRQGSVEDWTIENRSGEEHAFHIHQLHFQVIARNGKPVNEPTIRDTVPVHYWDGVSKKYPSVTLRMDFRDPETVGTFVYHCHILDHEDHGMMAKIKVKPAK
jgi:FtsP/CotA-like multicopper oxidase with cupredoxin domain